MNKTQENASYILMGLFLLSCYIFKLIPALISGIVVFILISSMYKNIYPKMQSKYAQKITLSLVVMFISLIFIGIFSGIYYGIQIGNNNFKELSEEVFKIIQEFKVYLPNSILPYVPENLTVFNEKLIALTKSNSASLFDLTTKSVKAFLMVIVGIILGAITAFSFLNYNKENNVHLPLAKELYKRVMLFGNVLQRVIFAQVKISAINTTLTAIYFVIVLPMFGYEMPYTKILILVTFIAGLIPVLGNLISNTVIVIIGLTVSFKIAVSSLVFLIVIHKLEYYINARIVGHEIKTKIWELLLVMIFMETLFGLIGLATAPIMYGYIKEELKLKHLV